MERYKQMQDSTELAEHNSLKSYLHKNIGTVQQIYAEPTTHKNNAWGDQIHSWLKGGAT